MEKPLLYKRKEDENRNRRRRRIFFIFFFIFAVLAIALPLALSQQSTNCACSSFSNYSFAPSPFQKCITFLNNSLYYLTDQTIIPFSVINGSVIYGSNQINNQSVFGNVYGCGRQDDTHIYISSDTYGLALVSTTQQNLTNLNGLPLNARGFAGYIYKVFENSLYLNNTFVANLTLSGCNTPVLGYGLSTYGGQLYIIYARDNFSPRRIGTVFTNGTVFPTCVNVTSNFTSMEFDNNGHLWVLDNTNLYNFSTPCRLQGDVPCGPFGTLKGSRIFQPSNNFGYETHMSGDGSTFIAGNNIFFTLKFFKVFRFNQNDWYQIGDTFLGNLFASSISQDGNIVAISNDDVGYSRVYRFVNCSWVQIGNDILRGGFALSLSPDGLTLASSSIFGTNSSMGITYIQDWNGSDWVLRGNPILGTMAQDYTGWSISMYGKNRIAIGSIEFTGFSTGRTQIYEWNGTHWSQMGQTIMGDNIDDNSGSSVSLQNNRVAIGAWQSDSNGTEVGETKIYEWNGTYWNQIGQDIQGEEAYDYSGGSVSLSSDGNTVAIGSIFNPYLTENGSVEIYDYINATWVQRGFDIAGPLYGRGGICSLSNDAKTVAIGAPTAGIMRVYCI